MIITSIDPGDRYVGICVYNIDEKKIFITQIDLETTTKQSIIDYISGFLKPNDKIIIENFINYNHKVQIKGYKPNPTSELIGVLEYWANGNNIEVIKQNATSAKIWDNKRLIRLGLLNEVGNKYYIKNVFIPKHTRDAYRHLIYYVNKTFFNGYISDEFIKEIQIYG